MFAEYVFEGGLALLLPRVAVGLLLFIGREGVDLLLYIGDRDRLRGGLPGPLDGFVDLLEFQLVGRGLLRPEGRQSLWRRLKCA
jgi:hypothetical protein